MEANLFVGDASSHFHIHFPAIKATFGRFLFKSPEQKIHNGETWTPLKLKQSTNEVIAKLLFSLKLIAKAQQMDGWVSAFCFRSRVVTIRYACITHSVINQGWVPGSTTHYKVSPFKRYKWIFPWIKWNSYNPCKFPIIKGLQHGVTTNHPYKWSYIYRTPTNIYLYNPYTYIYIYI